MKRRGNFAKAGFYSNEYRFMVFDHSRDELCFGCLLDEITREQPALLPQERGRIFA